MTIEPGTLEAFEALVLGFAFSGLLASGYEAVTRRSLGFGLLRRGGFEAMAGVPLLVFSAPLVIIRAVVRGRGPARQPFAAVVVATVIAGGWSILCGRLVLDAAHLFGAA